MSIDVRRYAHIDLISLSESYSAGERGVNAPRLILQDATSSRARMRECTVARIVIKLTHPIMEGRASPVADSADFSQLEEDHGDEKDDDDND